MIRLPVIGCAPPMPRTRAECVDGPRPCPHVRCRYHLALEVGGDGAIRSGYGATRKGGSVHPKTRRPYAVDYQIEALSDQLAERLDSGAPTCALDLADEGEQTLDAIGQILGLSREAVRQTIESARRKLATMDPEQRETLLAMLADLAEANGGSNLARAPEMIQAPPKITGRGSLSAAIDRFRRRHGVDLERGGQYRRPPGRRKERRK